MGNVNFQVMLANIRENCGYSFESYHPQGERVRFDTERKAMIVRELLNVLGADCQEARDLVGEVRDLLSRIQDAEQLTPTLKHFL